MPSGSDIGTMDQRLCQRTCQDEFGLQRQDQEGILDVIISQDGTRLHHQDRFLSRMPSLSYFKLSICVHAVMMGSDQN